MEQQELFIKLYNALYDYYYNDTLPDSMWWINDNKFYYLIDFDTENWLCKWVIYDKTDWLDNDEIDDWYVQAYDDPEDEDAHLPSFIEIIDQITYIMECIECTDLQFNKIKVWI